MYSGFAAYDALQEGLAVLAEYFVDGLTASRLRLLAARVVAVHVMIKGASFIDTFRAMQQEYQFEQRMAYTITMRTFRGGGLTKDAVYLRGLLEILHYLKKGGDLHPLFMGKIASEHIPLIRELQLRQVLTAPALQPRYLDFPETQERLERLRNGLRVVDLVKGATK